MRDLGEWSLKDFDRPVAVFEVVIEGLSQMRPGIRAAGRVRVVVADDSVLLREGIVRLLEQAGFDGRRPGGQSR